MLRARPIAAIALMLVAAACGSDDDSADESGTAVATTSPATTSPVTTSPETTSPVTTSPETTSPVTTSPVTSSAETTAPDEAASAAPFPVTVTGDAGELTIEEQPVAIVSLSPSLTEMVYAIGAGDQVVAVDGSSDFPEGTPMTDLSGFRPNVEAIGELGPDLVLLARDRDDIVATLAGVGIPALVLGAAPDVDTVAAQIRVLGEATGRSDAAEDLAEEIVADVETALSGVEPTSAPLSYYVELSNDYNSLTSDSLIGALMTEAGLTNVADEVDPSAGPFPQLSAEFVLDADPALVFVSHTDGSVPTLDELLGRPGWANLTAIANDDVVFLDADVASRWGPRVTDLAEAIAVAVNGAGPG